MSEQITDAKPTEHQEGEESVPSNENVDNCVQENVEMPDEKQEIREEQEGKAGEDKRETEEKGVDEDKNVENDEKACEDKINEEEKQEQKDETENEPREACKTEQGQQEDKSLENDEKTCEDKVNEEEKQERKGETENEPHKVEQEKDDKNDENEEKPEKQKNGIENEPCKGEQDKQEDKSLENDEKTCEDKVNEEEKQEQKEAENEPHEVEQEQDDEIKKEEENVCDNESKEEKKENEVEKQEQKDETENEPHEVEQEQEEKKEEKQNEQKDNTESENKNDSELHDQNDEEKEHEEQSEEEKKDVHDAEQQVEKKIDCKIGVDQAKDESKIIEEAEKDFLPVLNRVLTDINKAAPRRKPQLKESSLKSLASLKECKNIDDITEKRLMQQILETLLLGCTELSKNKIMISVLNVLQKAAILKLFCFETASKVVSIIEACSKVNDSAVQTASLDTSLQVINVIECEIHGENLSGILKMCYLIFVNARSASVSTHAGETLIRVVNSVRGKMTAKKDVDIYFNDFLAVFQFLCTLSVQELAPKEAANEDSRGMRLKIIALATLLDIVKESERSPVLQRDSGFIEKGLRAHLCAAIAQNGVSTNAKVLQYTLDLFYCILKSYKVFFKMEVGVFFSNIFLRLLESQNSTFQQKLLILQLLYKLCEDPETLTEMYINYDCDLKSTDVFVRMVNDLCKVSQGYSNFKEAVGSVGNNAMISLNKEKEVSLKKLSLECLVLVMKSLSNSVQEGKEQIKKLQEEEEGETGSTGSNNVQSTLSATQGADEVQTTEEDNGEDEELKKLREQKEQKKMLESIREKWVLDSKRAIAYMQKVGVIDETAKSLAKFLRETEGLDKKATGEYIGGSKPFNKDVLKEYVTMFNFAGMELDEALRFFLGQFLLPGEGQVVDRIMENFGQRYYLDNAESKRFEDADAVYKLSFAIIMLATDLHNPKVKNKLTFEQWEKMVNKDLAMGLDIEYLQNIFKRIAARRFELLSDNGSDNSGDIAGTLLSPKQRQEMFKEETSRWIDNAMKRIQEQNATNDSADSEYVLAAAKRITYVQAIFESFWASAVVSLSILLEGSEDPHVINLCLSGFKYGVHIAAAFYMETERDTFVTALEKFTLLSNYSEMRPKNIGAIRTLIEIAQTEGKYLQGSWENILRCISLLDRLHLTGLGSAPDFLPNQDSGNDGATSGGLESGDNTAPGVHGVQRSKSMLFRRGKEPSEAQLKHQISKIEVSNSQAVMGLAIDNAEIDCIFTESASLSDNEIIYFMEALCKISLDEISSQTPRNFSLQRIVEVITYNMNNRMRIVWSKLWVILQKHFIKCGCHDMTSVSMYALDSLRQLSMRYLEKDELANYNFQKEFMKPFEVVISTTKFDPVKEFIISCLQQIVLTRTSNIASGWKTIFVILTTCAEQEKPVLPTAFGLLTEILEKYFDVIKQNFFTDAIGALVAFGKNQSYKDIAQRSVALIVQCAKSLVDWHGGPGSAKFTDDLAHLRLWFPILTGLAAICSHPHIDIRTNALNGLFGVLSDYGELFSPKVWELIFRGVLIPIFDNVGYTKSCPVCNDIDPEWLNTTCLSAVQSFVLLFTHHFEIIGFLYDDLFNLLGAFVRQANDLTLATIGSSYFYQLVVANGSRFTPSMWSSFDAFIEKFFASDNDANRLIMGSVENEKMPTLHNPSSSSSSLQKASDETIESVVEKSSSEQTDNGEPTSIRMRSCAVCGSVENEKALLKCPMCEDVYYCSTKCQKTDWPDHQSKCAYKVKLHIMKRGGNAGNGSVASTNLSRFFTLDPIKYLSDSNNDENGKSQKQMVVIKCSIVKLVVKMLSDVLVAHYKYLSTDDISRIFVSLVGSLNSTSTILTTKSLCDYAKSIGCFGELLEKEKNILGLYITFAFMAYGDKNPEVAPAREALVERRLIALCKDILEQHIEKVNVSSRFPSVLLVLEKLLSIKDEQYDRHYPDFYSIFTKLVEDNQKAVRVLIIEHFIRIGKQFGITNNPLK